MALEQFSVTWDDFHKNMRSGMNSLLESEDFVDVTLAVEGRHLKAHKMVLSVCSPYFNELFKINPCKHPIVFMKDVLFETMSDLLQFMYKGEVQVSEENFHTFIKTAESLQIRGLSNYGNGSLECIESPSNKKKTIATSTNLLINETPPIPKLSDLNDHTSTICHELLKSEQTMMELPTATSSFNSGDFMSFKTEPCDEEDSSVGIADDNAIDNFFDDPLEDTSCVDEDDDYWMMEVGDNKKETVPEEDLIVSDIEEAAAPEIPEKSKKKYEHVLEYFEQWCIDNNVIEIDENVLIKYFKERTATYKPSTLMGHYSILRSMLLNKKNINISKYRSVITFLKKISKGHQTKRSEIFQKEDFEKFLREAKDDKFLMMKVAMIIGIAGACKTYELTSLHMENVIDEGSFIRVQLPDANNKISREFLLMSGNMANINLLEIVRKYIQLRPATTCHGRFFVAYRHGKCTKQPVGINTFGSMPKNIARFLGLPNPAVYTGHCFRRTSAILRLAQHHTSFAIKKNIINVDDE